MAAVKRKSATKKATSRSKPKSAKNASAKRVKRTTARKATSARMSGAPKRVAAAPKSSAPFAAQSDEMLKMGTDAIRQMLNAPQTKQTQEQLQKQMMNMSQESMAQMAKSADAASHQMNEMFSLSKDNMDTAVACGSIAVNASKSMGSELFNYANKSFSQNVEMSKEIFGCRTINDMFDLQSKVVKANLDHFFNESVKMSEMLFKTANQVSEPLNERVSENTNRLTKAMTEAA